MPHTLYAGKTYTFEIQLTVKGAETLEQAAEVAAEHIFNKAPYLEAKVWIDGQEQAELVDLEVPYKEPEKLEGVPIPEYGDLMTLDEFRQAVLNGNLMDCDGHGHYSDGKQMFKLVVLPGNELIPTFTHIVWFNK